MFQIARQAPSDEMGGAPQVYVYMIYTYVQYVYIYICIYIYDIMWLAGDSKRFVSKAGKTGKQRKVSPKKLVHVVSHGFSMRPSDFQLRILDQGKENPPSLSLVNPIHPRYPR